MQETVRTLAIAFPLENSICEHNHRNPIEEPKHDKLSLMWGEYKEGKVSYI